MSERIRVALLYGGRSSEHEISQQSAKAVLDNLDPERFDVLPIAIDRDGIWHAQDVEALRGTTAKALPVDTRGREVALSAITSAKPARGTESPAVDVVFPVLHGTLGEDGSMQGLMELADVAYVGSGVLGSAVCMDKDVAKRLARAAGLDVAPYVTVRTGQWPADAVTLRQLVSKDLGYPVFVKPANLGSSVGVSKVEREQDIANAIELALSYDTKILIERAIDAREIELAVLSALPPGGEPLVSVPGEVVPKGAFYDYEHKYLDPDGAELSIPARLSDSERDAAQGIARTAFTALECDGMARIDLFLERGTGRILFNESNTIPGFTTISMYPKLWEASGLSYADLLARLIELAVRRHDQRRNIKRIR